MEDHVAPIIDHCDIWLGYEESRVHVVSYLMYLYFELDKCGECVHILISLLLYFPFSTFSFFDERHVALGEI